MWEPAQPSPIISNLDELPQLQVRAQPIEHFAKRSGVPKIVTPSRRQLRGEPAEHSGAQQPREAIGELSQAL